MSLTIQILSHRFPGKKRAIHQLLDVMADMNFTEEQREMFCRSEKCIDKEGKFWLRFAEQRGEGRNAVIQFILTAAELEEIPRPIGLRGFQYVKPESGYSWFRSLYANLCPRWLTTMFQ